MGTSVTKGAGQSSSESAGEKMLALIREKYPNYHPILAIAEMAHDDKIEDPRLKLDCHKTIVKYVTPELKSVEVKAEINETRRVVVSMFDGEGSGQVYENSASLPPMLDGNDRLAENLLALPEELAA